MIRKAVLLIACIALSGCTTYGYRGGSGDYYYGSPTTTYRHYGAPYGSLGYGRGWYGGAGYGAPYNRYGGWNRYPYGYYGGGYYRPPVIVRPVHPGRPGHHHRPPRPGDHYQHARPESGRPNHGGHRPHRPGEARPHRPDGHGVGRPGGRGQGWSGDRPHRGDAGRPQRPRGVEGARPSRGEGHSRPQARPGFAPPRGPERVGGGTGARRAESRLPQ